MRYLLIVIILFLQACSNQSLLLPVTMTHVDLARYQGKWYEIASYPMFFQRGCVCTTAEYSAINATTINVKNSCRDQTPQGKIRVATAKAYPVLNSGNSKLKVQFFWPFKGDYWILFVDKDYQTAIVATPSRSYLWILSRSPQISTARYQQLLNIIKSQGFDESRLQSTNQSCFINQ